jgi:undecaprenyl-diphosphatase
MIGFFPLFCLFLLLTAELRTKLFSPALLLLILALFLAVAPIIIWNSQHDWITFQHTATHFQAEVKTQSLFKTLITHFNWCIEFQASQFLLMSPMLWLGMTFTFFAMLKNYRNWNQREKYLACFSLIPLLGILLLSTRQSLEPNWGAAFYPAGIILFVAQLEKLTSTKLQIVFSPSFKSLTFNTGILCTLLCYITTLGINFSPLSNTKYDFTNRLKGWKSFAQEVNETLAEHKDEDYQYISTTGRSIISELAFYLPKQPHIHRFNSTNITDSQYDIWGLPETAYRKESILISDHRKPLNADLTKHFSSIKHLGTTTPNSQAAHQYSIDLWLAQPHHDSTSMSITNITPPDNSVRK